MFLLSIHVLGQQSRQEYIKKYQLTAIREMNRSGVPASITMAQACLESADGNSELARKSNNHFGIKCKRSWKGGRVYYDDDRRNECFRKYTSVDDSFVDHSNFLLNNKRYAKLFKLKRTDYKGWAKGLKKAGYATAPHYAKELIRIIEQFKLYRLDYNHELNIIKSTEVATLASKEISNDLILDVFGSRTVEERNGIKSIVARKGDTYEIIAQELGMRSWQLYKYNDQIKGYRPQKGEIIYIKKKNCRTKDNQLTHIVEAGESMHYISQFYGIRLRPLYRRNRMKYGQHPKVGQVIYLRKRKPRNK